MDKSFFKSHIKIGMADELSKLAAFDQEDQEMVNDAIDQAADAIADKMVSGFSAPEDTMYAAEPMNPVAFPTPGQPAMDHPAGFDMYEPGEDYWDRS